MFLKRLGWLAIAIVAFISGIIVTVQWVGSDYGMDLYDLVKRPDVVEKVVEVEVTKVLVVSDDHKISIINQVYRDALLKISTLKYDGYNNEEKLDSVNTYAEKALSSPGVTAKDK